VPSELSPMFLVYVVSFILMYLAIPRVIFSLLIILFLLQEEKLKDKPGYEHLNEPRYILLEVEIPEDIIDARLEHSMAVFENLLKPVVCHLTA
jgi:hypothetical protein